MENEVHATPNQINNAPIVTNNMSLEKNKLLQQTAILTLLEDYCRFLLKEKIVDNKEAALAKVGTVASVALDRGDLTQADIDHVAEYINTTQMSYEAKRRRKCERKFLEHALTEEMCELTNAFTTGIGLEDLKATHDAYIVYKEKLDTIINAYSSIIKSNASNFIIEYGKLFDEQYITYIKPIFEIN